jgi:hypothetical protein
MITPATTPLAASVTATPAASVIASPATPVAAAPRQPPIPDVPDDETVVRRLLDAIVTRDEAALFGLFAEDLWFRAMLVREVVEHHDPVAAVAMFRGWFGRGIPLEVLRTATYPTASRHFLSYRFRLRPVWAPDVWHEIEQAGYVRVREGRVARLDLVCTGFVPQP